MALVRVVLTPVEWLPRRDRHRSRVTALLGGYLRQRGEGRSNPVIDFLFTYYNLTAGQLRRWHPGFGVTLTGPESHDYANLRGYGQTDSGVTVQPDHPAPRHSRIHRPLDGGHRKPTRESWLLRHARVGDGVQGGSRGATPPCAASAGAGRHGCGGGVDAAAMHPLRRVPLLHRLWPTPECRPAFSCRPSRRRATRLRPRRDGSVQMVVQVEPADRLRDAARLPGT